MLVERLLYDVFVSYEDIFPKYWASTIWHVSHFIVFMCDNYLNIILCVLLHHHEVWHECVNCWFHSSFVVKCLLQSLEVWRLAKIFETNKIYLMETMPFEVCTLNLFSRPNRNLGADLKFAVIWSPKEDESSQIVGPGESTPYLIYIH